MKMLFVADVTISVLLCCWKQGSLMMMYKLQIGRIS